MMRRLMHAVFSLSKWSNLIAGLALMVMMGLTVTDVALRTMGRPIVGVYELVAFLGAVVIGLSVPFTSWVRGHIYVDFFLLKLPRRQARIMNIVTRLMSAGLFLLIGWNLMGYAGDLRRSGEVSPTLQMPFYPVVFGIGLACLLQTAVLLGDIVKIRWEEYE